MSGLEQLGADISLDVNVVLDEYLDNPLELFMEERMTDSNNRFCRRDKELSFHKWDLLDVFRWKLMPDDSSYVSGHLYLQAYKAAFLQFNRDKIIRYAHQENIPLLLLSGTVVQEVGGKPDRLKYIIYLKRIFLDDVKNRNNNQSNGTSFGAVAMQLRAATETLGINPANLSTTQQLQLAGCLLDDDFNIKTVAKHLKELILFDNPNIEDTSNLTDEQLILAGSRYNRGIKRDKSDIIKSINSPKGVPEREYSSYGRRIIEKRKIIMKIMGGSK